MDDYQDAQFSDSVFVRLLGKKRNPNHYAQPEHLYLCRTYQAARSIKLFIASLTAATMLWCGINIADAFVLKHETTSLQSSVEQVQNSLRQLTGASHNEAINPENILAAVKISEALKKRSTRPDHLLKALGAALLQNPHLILDKLVWNSKQPTAQTVHESDEAVTKQIGTINNKVQSIIVAEGHISDFNGSYLEANSDVKLFVRKLSEQPGIVRADITRFPINTASSSAMAGKLLSNENPGKANFTVRVVMEVHREQS
jgi:hypothetical protein